ncbi:MFS general substrate transporter [Gymnopilus junonius]|uniref:MFS general substrate transporter n=1 Tax=Gymnopilus junonius TaxID=109634 RepID=A0A9P5TGQ6_GYMJU|nr:MFS general substrate transporter [Gymnopilus junonius]
MSEGSGSVTIQDVPSHPQSFEGEKCAVADQSQPHSSQLPQDSSIYDGGNHAWWTIVGAWIGSFQLFMQYIPGFFIGRAFDAGYFHYMIALGTILQITSMFMLSLARQHQYYEVFLAQAVGMGLGQSLLFLPSLTVIGHHFKRRRALSTGIAVSGASFGGIIWPILLNEFSQRTSFANAIRATAALCGVMLLASNFLMKTKPIACGSQRPNIRVICQDSAFLVSVASAFCINLGLFFPYFYLQLYAVNRKISNNLAFYSLAILNAGSALGRLLPNFFADKFGTYNLLLPCLFISSGLAFTMFAISDFPGVIVFGLLFGFWSGSYISLIPSLLAQLCNHAKEQGTRMGIAFSIVGISMLVGTPIEGSLLKSDAGHFAWSRSIIFCGTMIFCGAIGMAISRTLFVRQGRAGSRGHYV